MSVELVHVMRGGEVESIHRGDIVGVDKEGKILFEYGCGSKRTFWRSSAKPVQVIPFIEAGGLEHFDIESKELALMTSSHGGEPDHVQVLKGLLGKLNKRVEDLDCGVSRPMYEGEYRRMLKADLSFSQANNPCSGKHSNMLGLGILKDLDMTDYILPEHPIQQIMIGIAAEMTDLKKEEIDLAIDGCGVPVFGLPIYNMAIAYAKLAGPFDKSKPRQTVLKTIASAMTSQPYYVAGTNRLDTILMEETQGRILAKLGAESVYCMSIMDQNVGIAMKTEDGGYRALDCLVPQLLYKHGYITEDELNRINNRLRLLVKNHRGQTVGKLLACI